MTILTNSPGRIQKYKIGPVADGHAAHLPLCLIILISVLMLHGESDGDVS